MVSQRRWRRCRHGRRSGDHLPMSRTTSAQTCSFQAEKMHASISWLEEHEVCRKALFICYYKSVGDAVGNFLVPGEGIGLM